MRTSIEWVAEPGTIPEVINFIGGCSAHGSACRNCWACRMATTRLKHHPLYEGVAEIVEGKPRWTDRVNVDLSILDQIPKWRKKRTVFWNSMSDLFITRMSFEEIYQVFDVMGNTLSDHNHKILTKRPERMMDFCFWYLERKSRYQGIVQFSVGLSDHRKMPDNIHFGVSVWDQDSADRAMPSMALLPARWCYVSYEPALGPVNWDGWEFLDQIIFGGENGPNARPAHPQWFRDTVEWCEKNDVNPFFKQWGEWIPMTPTEAGFYPNYRLTSDGSFPSPLNPRTAWMAKVGKKKAGHLLDGKEYRFGIDGRKIY